MIALKNISRPEPSENPWIELSDATIQERIQKVRHKMQEKGLDTLIVYGDLEHGSNFEYLTGFLPRFEEALLVMHQNGEAFLILGNENLNKAAISRLEAKGIHVPFFSLPNQPMSGERDLADVFAEAGIVPGKKIGIAGWKLFTSSRLDNLQLYDLPEYLMQAIRNAAGENALVNAADLFIGEGGVRQTNNANEIAHYAYYSQLASQAMEEALDAVEPGISEMEIASHLNQYGQRNSVVTIAATGERFEKANLYPSPKKVKTQDKMSLTVGYRGGLSSRAGYAVKETEDLPVEVQDWLDVLAKPYFQAVATWLETIRTGVKGEELYAVIEKVLPKEEYNWKLNPGHLIGEEEWMASPIYPGSQEELKSGMLLQIDIIPSRSGYGGVCCETGIGLADETLRDQLAKEYPDLWKNIQNRQAYIRDVLGIALHEDVLPLNDTVAYYRPYFLNPSAALIQE